MNFNNIDLLCGDSTEVFQMSFRDPIADKSYVMKQILGLDVGEITTRYFGRSTAGQSFYSMSLGQREIVMLVSMNPKYSIGESVASLRDKVYKALSTTRTGALKVRFKYDDLVIAVIEGFATKVEVDHFSATPDLKLTLNCNRDPLLRSEQEFPISPVFDNPLQAVLVDDLSTAPHGIKMELTCSADVESFRIYDTVPDEWSFEIAPGVIGSAEGFQDGDKLYISSEDNNRYVYIVRSGTTYHLGHRILAKSIWPMMFPGTTTFNITGGFDWVDIKYRTAYWGI